MDLNTPALLFGSISLFNLAYTNRFIALAKLVRELTEQRESRTTNVSNPELINAQIPVLRKRLFLIKNMQGFGVLSFIFCTGSLLMLFIERAMIGQSLFGISVVALLISLAFGLWEVVISTEALDIILKNTFNENLLKRKNKKS